MPYIVYLFILQHMNLFHDLLKQNNMTLVTSAVMSDDNADVRPLISRLLVSLLNAPQWTHNVNQSVFSFPASTRSVNIGNLNKLYDNVLRLYDPVWQLVLVYPKSFIKYKD